MLLYDSHARHIIICADDVSSTLPIRYIMMTWTSASAGRVRPFDGLKRLVGAIVTAWATDLTVNDHLHEKCVWRRISHLKATVFL